MIAKPRRRYGWPSARRLLDRCQVEPLALAISQPPPTLVELRMLWATQTPYAQVNGQTVPVTLASALTEADLSDA